MIGGAGYILSVGLLNAIPREFWKRCSEEIVCGGGDVRVAACIQNAGINVGLTHWGDLSVSCLFSSTLF